jgi:2'-5' RNA ligase
MPYAVTLHLDPAAAARVQRMWHALADLTGEDDALRLGYPPHLTLAVLPDTVPAPSIKAAVLRVAAVWDALPVTLAGLAVFPGTPPVLWAAPVPSNSLLARHGMLHAALAPLPVHPHYRPGGWVPHVTLSRFLGLAQRIRLRFAIWGRSTGGWDGGQVAGDGRCGGAVGAGGPGGVA